MTLLKETYGLAPTVKWYMNKGKETIVHSKSTALSLFELSPTYKTCPRDCSPEEYFQGLRPSLSLLKNKDVDLFKEAIRVAMSTDGTAYVEFPRKMIYPKLEFACANPNLLKERQTMFDKNGIKTS